MIAEAGRLPVFVSLVAGVAGGLSPASAGEISSGRWVIHSESPAPEWEHGMVVGNGRHGARVMGHPGDERITINHEELFVRFWIAT